MKQQITTIRKAETQTCEMCGKETHYYVWAANDCALCIDCANLPLYEED